jgi:hypothetical protein
VLVLVILTVSCGEGRFKEVYPVKGEVFFEGQPAAGATVAFFALDEPKDPLVKPMGKVDAEGRFTLSTYKKDDGAPAGSYAVTVIWLPQGYQGPIESANKLPARYSSPETSGLKVTVAQGENGLEPFRLKK